jgi:hypothetical protein
MDDGKVREQIKTAFQKAASPLRHINERPSWTIAIKSELAHLGRELGFEVCCKGVSPGQTVEWGEWLFDMCWLERDDRAESYIYKSMPFAMECEWDLPIKHCVLPDLQKLVFSAAQLRLLVWHLVDVEEDVGLFRKQITAAKRRSVYVPICRLGWSETGIYIPLSRRARKCRNSSPTASGTSGGERVDGTGGEPFSRSLTS